MDEINGEQHKQLEEALSSAFPSMASLERMVTYCLDEDLSKIAGGSNLSEVIYNLIKWAGAQGRLDELIIKAHQQNPGNAKIKSFHDKHLPKGKSFPNRNKSIEEQEKGTQISRVMFIQKSSSSYSSEANWLDHFGFESSPFTGLYSTSAEHADPSFLSNCFVDPDCLFDVLGQASIPAASILHGESGEGKTACRVMVDYLCLHGGVPDIGLGHQAYVLSVPHVNIQKISINPTLEQHVVEILERAMPQFVDLLMQEEVIKSNLTQVDVELLAELNWYIDFYNRHLTIQQSESLSRLGIKMPYDFTTYPSLEKRTALSSVDHLTHWCKLMIDIGIRAVYVLVDGFDDTGALKINTLREESYKILAPLLRNRELIDRTPHFALKCFVPTYMKEMIQADNLSNNKFIKFYPIKWTKEKMIELLQQRILFFRRDDYPTERAGFEDLCVTELAGIEDMLVDIAGFNPRHMLMLCDFMVKAHCRADHEARKDPFKLTPEDLTVAQKDFDLWLNRYGSESTSSSSEISELVSERENLESENSYISSQSVKQVRGSNNIDILAMIKEGENNRVEFKSSMLRDTVEDKQNDNLIMAIGKEIAGMLNSDGGFILIGVDDEGEILGIEGDFKFLGKRNKKRPDSEKQNIDGYGLKLTDLIKDQLGANALGAVDFSFVKIKDLTICLVEIQPSSQPVYFGKAEDYFIRHGTSTLRLTPSQVDSYKIEHWRK